ncbi:MAG: hypothetical protein DSY90_09745 [Deltaproteobacteria bacterium]|nr:MAG: hypothetical protein DSY90_09745 [Deltaproteobacteria bacterium]RUA01099.1 MAG: hypothetical protein DSY89_05445 [Deltaproteobacteria bacterium]
MQKSLDDIQHLYKFPFSLVLSIDKIISGIAGSFNGLPPYFQPAFAIVSIAGRIARDHAKKI